MIRLGDEGEMVASRIKSRPEWLFSSMERRSTLPNMESRSAFPNFKESPLALFVLEWAI